MSTSAGADKAAWNYFQINTLTDNPRKDWADMLKNVCKFSSEGELLDSLDQIGEIGLHKMNDLYLFKDNIMPMWEDSQNINGGRIIVEIPQSMKENINNVWRRTAALCYVNAFSVINGCVINEKAPSFRISLWVSSAHENDDIIECWKTLLNLPAISFNFSFHNKGYDSSSKQKKRNNFKNKY
ncbi:translation initiation factor 4E [Enteropsectra breve]|nr:translation initiation factor 4E [Enteropsectra breve]